MSHLQEPVLTEELLILGTSRWQQLQSHSDFDLRLNHHKTTVIQAFALSEFVSEQCLSKPQYLLALLLEEQLFAAKIDYQQLLQSRLEAVENEQQLLQNLRQFRQFQMLRIAWRDLLNWQSIQDSLVQVSELARQLVNQTNHWLHHSLQDRFGQPLGEHGPQPMLILGMGKLGGNELNFSSDIDLIFTYPAQGETQGGRKSIEHQQFFTKLAQKLISALNQITADGQVYRVDMRLRPFGDSGPLVMHFDAMEDYYQEQGRDWERYAMLKANILNGPSVYKDNLAAILRPFIYRRYLDFSAIESLRNMKSAIQQEVRRRGLTNNIKLGQGGIREAEFIIQSLQLIQGGREPSLQVQSLQMALSQLVQLDILISETADSLLLSYLWLRKVEHCLQQFADKQTQVLPDEPIDQQRLIVILGMDSYSQFLASLGQHCDVIHQQFQLLVNDENEQLTQQLDEYQQAANDLWSIELDHEEADTLLALWALNKGATTGFHQQLVDFKLTLTKQRIGQRGLSTLNSLMPIILKLVLSNGSVEQPSELIRRIISVMYSVLGRTAYLQLLLENQGALLHLVKLCGASVWVTAQIARFPLLLDELLNPVTLYQPVAINQYRDELRQALMRVEPDDLELQIETLRQFKLSQQLKIAAADIANALPIMQVSNHLTYLAEALIKQAVDMAWSQVTAKHGLPVCQNNGTKSMQDKGFAVLGYGKLGGWELGYGSDLDLVFVHNCHGNQPTTGIKPIDSSSFYIKLAQRILHIFTIKTGLGLLYDVDMRLRPSGNAGLLVCHVNGFAQYQQDNAWTWEHQALCRARFVLGDIALEETFTAVRLRVLSIKRDPLVLAQDVVKMREKMRQHLAKGNSQQLDLKQDVGGIADIEFIVQFMLLAHITSYPQLTKHTDNVRVLADLVSLNLLDSNEAQRLTQAYLAYRNTSHRIALQNITLAQATPELLTHQRQVKAIWEKYLGN
jgi:glutamate-ammonia-ligase adenylyltransferase